MSKAGTEVQASSHHLGGPALRAFSNIAERWELTDADQARLLGLRNKGDLIKLKMLGQPDIDQSMLERISHLLSIYGSLRTFFPEAPCAAAWLRKRNKAPLFEGGTALQKMSTGELSDLAVVRRYLEAECG